MCFATVFFITRAECESTACAMGKKSRQQPKPPTQPHPKHRARKKQPKQESNSDSGSRSQPPTAPGPRRRQKPSLPSSRNRAQPGPHVERPMSGSASAADLSTTMPPVVEVDGQYVLCVQCYVLFDFCYNICTTGAKLIHVFCVCSV